MQNILEDCWEMKGVGDAVFCFGLCKASNHYTVKQKRITEGFRQHILRHLPNPVIQGFLQYLYPLHFQNHRF